MNITNYINSKSKCYVFNLTSSKEILDKLNLKNYPNSNKYNESNKINLSKIDLVIFIINSSQVDDKSIFMIVNKLNNVLIYVINDELYQKNNTKYKNIFISYGFKCHSKTNDDKVIVFIYDIAEYKDNPDWLNNENWANPELWEK